MPSESVPDRRSFVVTVLRGIVLVVVGGVGTLIAACSPSGVGAGGQGATSTGGRSYIPVPAAGGDTSQGGINTTAGGVRNTGGANPTGGTIPTASTTTTGGATSSITTGGTGASDTT